MAEIVAGRPERQPTHPGKVLRDIVMPALVKGGMGVSAFADHLGVSRNTLHAILRSARAVSPDIAARLERSLGGSAAVWLNMQAAHDAWDSSRKPEVKAIKRLSITAPSV